MTGADAPTAPLWGGARFDNPWPATWRGDKTPAEVWRFMREMRALKAPRWGRLERAPRPSLADMAAAFPMQKPDYGALVGAPEGGVAAIWAGHAAVLVRLGGVTFLTDPMFEDRASPLPFLGPRRAVPSAVVPEDPELPRVDAVLVSHNHYDHLSAASVRRLHRRFGDDLAWYVPIGLKAWFTRRGIQNVTELTWWQSARHPGSRVDFTLTPAQHWSARGALDRRRTLWGGWAAAGPGARFFFAGDTGYCAAFEEIGRRLGPFDLAAIPTGAYAPRGFMAPQHVDPAEAVRIHRDVRARRSIAVHCCTFHLTLEPLDEPPRLLAAEAAAAGLAPDEFVTLRHGAGIAVLGGEVLTKELLTLPLPFGMAADAGTDRVVAGGEGDGTGAPAPAAAREEL